MSDFSALNAFPRQKHSLIEKRRRKKMNDYVAELSKMIPLSSTCSKVDKISVLRKTVRHIKSLQGSADYWEPNKPPFLSNTDMKKRLKRESGDALFVIKCDQGRFVHMSEAMAAALGINQNEWLGLSIFDKLHHEDIGTVKEQLSQGLVPNSPGTDHESSFHKGITSGSWRSFYCRLKIQCSSSEGRHPVIVQKQCSQQCHELAPNESPVDWRAERVNDRRKKSGHFQPNFLTIHCTGIVKVCTLADCQGCSPASVDEEQRCICLILAVHALDPYSKPPENLCCYQSRIDADGKIVHIGKSATRALGYSPQELIGTSVYSLYHEQDLTLMARAYQLAFQSRNHVITPVHRIKAKSGRYVAVQNDMFNFVNPWTNSSDYIMCWSLLKSVKEFSQQSARPTDVTGTMKEKNTTRLQQANRIEARKTLQFSLSAGSEKIMNKVPILPHLALNDFIATMSTASEIKLSASHDRGRKSRSATFGKDQHSVPSDAFGMLTSAPNTFFAQREIGTFSIQNKRQLDLPTNVYAVNAPLLPKSSHWGGQSTNEDEGYSEKEFNLAKSESAISIAMSLLEDDLAFGGHIDSDDFPWAL